VNGERGWFIARDPTLSRDLFENRFQQDAVVSRTRERLNLEQTNLVKPKGLHLAALCGLHPFGSNVKGGRFRPDVSQQPLAKRRYGF
jgi:hypothetical protein